jgi:hypothetical protein
VIVSIKISFLSRKGKELLMSIGTSNPFHVQYISVTLCDVASLVGFSARDKEK